MTEQARDHPLTLESSSAQGRCAKLPIHTDPVNGIVARSVKMENNDRCRGRRVLIQS
jgi:hypothetical protein